MDTYSDKYQNVHDRIRAEKFVDDIPYMREDEIESVLANENSGMLGYVQELTELWPVTHTIHDIIKELLADQWGIKRDDY